jgi:hypothetical protein
MTPRPHKPHHTLVQPNCGTQSGIVLLTVLVMLVVASAWATYAWRQVFWQQRMLHSQGLEFMAWQAAEAGALQLWHQKACPKTGGALLEGLPGTRWRIGEFLEASQPCTLYVIGEVFDTSADATLVIAQAHLLLEFSDLGDPLKTHITRWQRVYPR